MMINYLSVIDKLNDQLFSLKLIGLGVLPACIITIDQLNLLCLGGRAIFHADILLFTDAWFYLKDYSLFWSSWLIWSKDWHLYLSWWQCAWFWAFCIVFLVTILFIIDSRLYTFGCDLPILNSSVMHPINWSSSKWFRQYLVLFLWPCY